MVCQSFSQNTTVRVRIIISIAGIFLGIVISRTLGRQNCAAWCHSPSKASSIIHARIIVVSKHKPFLRTSSAAAAATVHWTFTDHTQPQGSIENHAIASVWPDDGNRNDTSFQIRKHRAWLARMFYCYWRSWNEPFSDTSWARIQLVTLFVLYVASSQANSVVREGPELPGKWIVTSYFIHRMFSSKGTILTIATRLNNFIETLEVTETTNITSD